MLSSHEFFHAVEAAYDADQGSVIAKGAPCGPPRPSTRASTTSRASSGASSKHRSAHRQAASPVRSIPSATARRSSSASSRSASTARSSARSGRRATPQPWLPALDRDPHGDYARPLPARSPSSRAGTSTPRARGPSQSYANGAMYPPVMTTPPAAFLERLAAPRLLRVGAVLERLARLAGPGGGGADRRRHGGPRDRDRGASRQRDHAR